MAVTAFDEAKTFLFRHPGATTDIDDPVRLLEDLVYEIKAGGLVNGGDDRGMQPSNQLSVAEENDRVANLLSFIKDLREQEKISEAEYQIACAIE